MSQFNQTFLALLKEAQFTKQLLGAGATEIRKANYANKGSYFQAFTSLSTGLERIGKLCLMLDYYVENNGLFPDLKYLKNDIGHNLEVIQNKALEAIDRRNFRIVAPSTNVHNEIVSLLSNFAKGDRYSNIDLLVGSSKRSDPIESWFNQVDIPLFRERVTKKKKQKIEENARIVSGLIGPVSQVVHTSETGSDIANVEEASYRTGVYEAVAPYRQLYVLQIIRFWAKLTRAYQYLAMRQNRGDIPYFGELFAPFENSDSYFRTRKTWDSF